MTTPQPLLDAVAAALAIVDAQGVVQAVDAAFTALTGAPATTVVGRRVETLFTAASTEALHAARRNAAGAGAATDDLELELRRADHGDALPVRVHLRAVAGVEWLTLVDRRRELHWQSRAEHGDELLNMVQEFGRLGIWERDTLTLDGRWDRHIHRFWGLDGTQATPSFNDALRHVVADDRDGVRQAFLRSVQQAGTYSHHYRVAGADGQLRRVHSQWEVKNDAAGKPRRALGIITDDTEVWRMAQTVGETHAQLTLALELGHIVIWRHDLRQGRLFYNDQGWRTLGLEPRPEGFSLEEVRARIHPDDRAQVQATLERAMHSTVPTDMEARYLHADGTWRYILTRRVTQRDDAGRPIAFLGVAMDLTERVQEQRRLQELTRRLDMAATAAGVGIWSYDFAQRLAHWNAQMYALHGLSPDVAAPDWPTYLDTFIAADRRAGIARGWQLLADEDSERVAQTDLHIVRADGALRQLAVRIRAMRVDGASQMIGTMIDVTEQRAEQSALREAHAREALAVRAVGVGIWETDIESGASIWNEQMWRLRGLEPGAAAPSYNERMALIHPDDAPRVERESDAAKRNRLPWSLEFRVRWPDGSWHWLASRSTPLLDPSGRASRRIGVNWDVTDARGAEQARQERLVAQGESRAKSAFLARMSHELRTPLHAVIGFAQLLLTDERLALHDDARERVGHIRTAGRHLLALVDDVLDLSSLDAGEIRLDLRSVDLHDVIDAVLPMVAAQAEAGAVQIACKAVHHCVRADPTRLRQVLLNLLTNAIKYNHRGGSVRLQARSEGTMVVLEVRDTGRGMTGQQLAHVFEAFNRLGVEREEGIEGTGIGLAIVKINVERMGGSVSVESRPGQGSCFAVRLPAGQVSDDSPVPATAITNAPVIDATTPRIPGARVLYIEDNPVNALIVRELIAQRRDLQLDEAADGHSGIECARAARPDLILLDMQLPDIDGMEVLRRLRADAATAAIPCIALSANAMPDDIRTALGAGFADYWTKPLDFRVFMSALDSLFGKAP